MPKASRVVHLNYYQTHKSNSDSKNLPGNWLHWATAANKCSFASIPQISMIWSFHPGRGSCRDKIRPRGRVPGVEPTLTFASVSKKKWALLNASRKFRSTLMNGAAPGVIRLVHRVEPHDFLGESIWFGIPLGPWWSGSGCAEYLRFCYFSGNQYLMHNPAADAAIVIFVQRSWVEAPDNDTRKNFFLLFLWPR